MKTGNGAPFARDTNNTVYLCKDKDTEEAEHGAQTIPRRIEERQKQANDAHGDCGNQQQRQLVDGSEKEIEKESL